MRFDLDAFITDCLDAASDQPAVADVVGRAVSQPTMLEQAFTKKLDLSKSASCTTPRR